MRIIVSEVTPVWFISVGNSTQALIRDDLKTELLH